jgi:nucleotidyltransferase/DNA polymerase involved in DNA repair
VRIAFVSIPRFLCAVEISREPRLAGKLLIVGDAEQPKHVLDCSAESGRSGVRQGMTIRQATGLCPDAVILPPDPVLYRNRWERVLDVFDGLSPEIEDEEMGRAYLNVSGLQHLYRDESDLCASIISAVKEASGLEASTGLAEGKFAAFAAGTLTAPGRCRVVPAPEVAEFLAPLGVDLLPFDPDIKHRLRLLGLERIGDVAALSLPELQSQFGFAGKRLSRLAAGIDEEPLKPRKRPEVLHAEAELETAVAGIDVMIAIARQLLSRLRLALNGRAARELTLQAELVSGRGWEHHLVFREAVSEEERLVFLLRAALNNFPPPQAIASLSLRLSNLTHEKGKQLSLGQKGRRKHHLEEAIRQLKVRYGYSPIYRCLDVESWSVIPEERQILVESDV